MALQPNSCKRARYEEARYEGDKADGKRHGPGTQTYPNGKVYCGTWFRDEYHGQGELTLKDGGVTVVYKGLFKHNSLCGDECEVTVRDESDRLTRSYKGGMIGLLEHGFGEEELYENGETRVKRGWWVEGAFWEDMVEKVTGKGQQTFYSFWKSGTQKEDEVDGREFLTGPKFWKAALNTDYYICKGDGPVSEKYSFSNTFADRLIQETTDEEQLRGIFVTLAGRGFLTYLDGWKSSRRKFIEFVSRDDTLLRDVVRRNPNLCKYFLNEIQNKPCDIDQKAWDDYRAAKDKMNLRMQLDRTIPRHPRFDFGQIVGKNRGVPLPSGVVLPCTAGRKTRKSERCRLNPHLLQSVDAYAMWKRLELATHLLDPGRCLFPDDIWIYICKMFTSDLVSDAWARRCANARHCV